MVPRKGNLMAKQIQYPPALDPPEYYYRWWKDERGKRFHCVFERNIAGEDGIAVFESVREVDAKRYLADLQH